MRYLSLLFIVFFTSCQSNETLTRRIYGDHFVAKKTYTLSSPEGQEALKTARKIDMEPIKKYWEPQLKSHCGICSIVITINTLKDKKKLGQNSIFTKDVNKIITQKTVFKMGMTLRELTAVLDEVGTGIESKEYYAHKAGLDLFKVHLLKATASEKDMLIVNFSRKSIAGTGMTSGHFSIIGAYDPKGKRVLIYEVNGSKESFWIKTRDLYTAMLAKDPVSMISRGWVFLSK